MLLKNGIDLYTGTKNFINSASELYIFTPFVRLDALQSLLEDTTTCRALILRWEAQDLLMGSSDLGVYEYCKNRNIQVFRNPRLHLKAYVDNCQRCLLGSANISVRALNLDGGGRYNFEIGTIEESLSIEDRIYFTTIIAESILITDRIFDEICKQLAAQHYDPLPRNPAFALEEACIDQHFLISSLPMSSSLETFTKIYFRQGSYTEEELNCAIHDMVLYRIPPGLPYSELIQSLSFSFFDHPFIKAFVNRMKSEGGYIYFGEAKAWIQEKCTDVPIPRRWELTLNTQILYRWTEELSNGRIKIQQPNVSQKLVLMDR